MSSPRPELLRHPAAVPVLEKRGPTAGSLQVKCLACKKGEQAEEDSLRGLVTVVGSWHQQRLVGGFNEKQWSSVGDHHPRVKVDS